MVKKSSGKLVNTSVSDLIFGLLKGVASVNNKLLYKTLPKVLNYIMENGQPTISTDSFVFWSNENYTFGVSLFAQSITNYSHEVMPRILFDCVI